MDLVARLRAYYSEDRDSFCVTHDICDEAADEIERLRGELTKCAEWRAEPPTEPGYYWTRYTDMHGNLKDPDIIWLVEPGRAFEFGTEHAWEPGVGHFEYGPKIDPPPTA